MKRRAPGTSRHRGLCFRPARYLPVLSRDAGLPSRLSTVQCDLADSDKEPDACAVTCGAAPAGALPAAGALAAGTLAAGAAYATDPAAASAAAARTRVKFSVCMVEPFVWIVRSVVRGSLTTYIVKMTMRQSSVAHALPGRVFKLNSRSISAARSPRPCVRTSFAAAPSVRSAMTATLCFSSSRPTLRSWLACASCCRV